MQTSSLSYAKYWRNSLADADAGNGAFQVTPKFRNLSEKELSTGLIGQPTIDACFAKEAEHTHLVEVVIRPKVYVLPLEHVKQRRAGTPAFVTPIVASAKLARDGRLYPLSRIVVPRDILEPLERGSFSIGLVSDQDAFLSTNTIPGIDAATDDSTPLSKDEFSRQWASFLAACDLLLEQTGKGWPADEDDYILTKYGYLVKKESRSANQHIIALYDHIRDNSPSAPLFERYTDTNLSPAEPCLPPHGAFSRRLAHASNKFPLAPAQRHALAHLMAAKAGEILAINGPPGTGKTSLLLSVVASLWAEAAIASGEPPVVLAASTNNQAVTNILDAFGKDFATGDGPFAGRWLPRVSSFGAYFPAKSKKAEASKQFQTHGFFEEVETDAYVTEAQEAYLRAAAAAFPDIEEPLDVQGTVNALRTTIQAEAKKLTDIESAWSDLSAARTAVHMELGEAPAASMTQRRQQLGATTEEKCAIDRLAKQWEGYLEKEPLVYAILSWLPPVAKKRIRRARRCLKQIWPDQLAQGSWESIDKIETSIKIIAGQMDQTVRQQVCGVERGEAVLKAERACLAKWQAALVPLGKAEQAGSLSLADCDPLADTHIRFKIFLLTTHYWEGRWLLEMQDLLPEIKEERKREGRVTLEKRWRRRMKLTPCIVSTFFMLPEKMRVQRGGRGEFVSDYLYDFTDLLIVDEAGQVLPEVAGASFALSKKALVIGDTMQIEPIWSVPRSVDVGNMLSAKLLPSEDHEDAYDQLSEIGKTAASGSVMRISQTLTRYHCEPALDRGMFLYEHYRCVDEIISYCNALCYKDKLIPKRGKKIDAKNSCDDLPALGYLHIDGICQKSSGGSRRNMHEAGTIAAWLVWNRDSLEASYGKRLHEIVGVVTPFAVQVQTISTACRNAGIKVGSGKEEMTVGTVHSLQGAERPVVIFSPTYTKHADGSFIDDSRSMLNVAVSRAKNTFLVFGDMDVFESIPKKRPRGLLATHLFEDRHNALHFEHQARQDLTGHRR